MTTQTISMSQKPTALGTARWLWIALQAALVAVAGVLITQLIILALRPEFATFGPLDSYVRSVLFTAIPAFVATGVFAWIAKTQDRPVTKFLWISAGVLLLSFIPDYVLPIPNRTLPAATAAAFLHIIAGIITVAMIVRGYNHSVRVNK